MIKFLAVLSLTSFLSSPVSSLSFINQINNMNKTKDIRVYSEEIVLDIPLLKEETNYYGTATAIASILEYITKNKSSQTEIYKELLKITKTTDITKGMEINSEVASYLSKETKNYTFSDLGLLFGRYEEDWQVFEEYIKTNMQNQQPLLLSFSNEERVFKSIAIYGYSLSPGNPEYDRYFYLDTKSGQRKEFLAKDLQSLTYFGNIIGGGQIFTPEHPARDKIEVPITVPIETDKKGLEGDKDEEVATVDINVTKTIGSSILSFFAWLFGAISLPNFVSWISSITGDGWFKNGSRSSLDDLPENEPEEWEDKKRDEDRKKEKTSCKSIENYVKRQLKTWIDNNNDRFVALTYSVGSIIKDEPELLDKTQDLTGRIKVKTGDKIVLEKREKVKK